jgi:hypothetical protein
MASIGGGSAWHPPHSAPAPGSIANGTPQRPHLGPARKSSFDQQAMQNWCMRGVIVPQPGQRGGSA